MQIKHGAIMLPEDMTVDHISYGNEEMSKLSDNSRLLYSLHSVKLPINSSNSQGLHFTVPDEKICLTFITIIHACAVMSFLQSLHHLYPSPPPTSFLSS